MIEEVKTKSLIYWIANNIQSKKNKTGIVKATNGVDFAMGMGRRNRVNIALLFGGGSLIRNGKIRNKRTNVKLKLDKSGLIIKGRKEVI